MSNQTSLQTDYIRDSLRQAFEQSDLSVKQLAEMTGINHATIYRSLINGETKMTTGNASKIIDALDLKSMAFDR